jgi:hypothetical protein
MHVRILRSSYSGFWYTDSIGDRFDISEEQLTSDSKDSRLVQKDIFGRAILSDDCEVLHPDKECDCREKFFKKDPNKIG